MPYQNKTKMSFYDTCLRTYQLFPIHNVILSEKEKEKLPSWADSMFLSLLILNAPSVYHDEENCSGIIENPNGDIEQCDICYSAKHVGRLTFEALSNNNKQMLRDMFKVQACVEKYYKERNKWGKQKGKWGERGKRTWRVEYFFAFCNLKHEIGRDPTQNETTAYFIEKLADEEIAYLLKGGCVESDIIKSDIKKDIRDEIDLDYITKVMKDLFLGDATLGRPKSKTD